MFGKGFRLYKREKLCSVTAINRLFTVRISKEEVASDNWGEIRSALVYPLRAVYGRNEGRGGAPCKFLISIPKKKLRRAVDRVTMRRRVREAYRLVRGDISNIDSDMPKLDIVFIYVANELVDFSRVHKAMTRLMAEMLQKEEETAD